MSGKRRSTAIGVNLHIVAVTAKLVDASKPLVENVVYHYDMVFDVPNLSTNLAIATADASLAYSPFDLPSFCLPPHDLNQLRLIHGSCRMPHGNGQDGLSLLNDLINQTAQTPLLRPHQLFMTGDQIYADDVAPSMIIMLSDAADVLLGWQEKLPVPSHFSDLAIGSQASPFMRREMLSDAGFTSEDLDSHLMTLGEYICMYLFVWSDVLWTAQLIPSRQEVILNIRANMGVTTLPPGVLPPKDPIPGDIRDLTEFRRTLPDVRRALANIPSYTIMDDHEITDDWNMTLQICKGMYGNSLGLRIVQNGLVAYALCQHWGNVPEQFEDTGQAPPGLTLLRLLDGGDAAQYEANSPSLRQKVGVHEATAIAAQKAVFHEPNSLIYNYTVVGPSHQVIVTDTRTWRSFPFAEDGAGELLPASQIAAQIGAAPDPGDRALLVVLSTNAPAIEAIRTATRHSTLSNALSHYPDIFEAWELAAEAVPSHPLASRAFDRLMKAISDKLPLVSGERRGPAMLLSGDVHMSFASRLLYKATARYEDPQHSPQPVTAVIAQLVASSFKKQTDDTLYFHANGYASSPHAEFLLHPYKPEGYAGWNLPPGQKKTVGRATYVAGRGTTQVDLDLKGPTTVFLSDHNIIIKGTVTQDYGYTLQYLPAASQGGVSTPSTQIPPIPPGATPAQRKQAIDGFKKAAGGYRTYNSSGATTREIVGINNLCEITFDWGAGPAKKVNHTARWRQPLTQVEIFSTYTVSLDPADLAFPEIKS